MRLIIWLVVLAWCTAADAQTLQRGTTPPAQCQPGDVFVKTNAPSGSNLYSCVGAEWVLQAGGGGGGSGNVSNSGGATDNAIARFDQATGQLIKNSSAILDNAGYGFFPGGVGTGSGATAGAVVLSELTANGNNYVALVGPDSRTTDLKLVLPAADPNGQLLQCGAPTSGTSTCSWVTVGGGGDALVGGANTWTAANNFSAATMVLPTSASPGAAAGQVTYNDTTHFLCVSDGTTCVYYLTAGKQQDVGSKNLYQTVYHVDSADTTKKIKFEPTAQAASTTTTFATLSQSNRTVYVPDHDFVIPHKLVCTDQPSATLTNSAGGAQPFSNTCIVPSGHLSTGVMITVDVAWNLTTPATNTNEGFQICLQLGNAGDGYTNLYCHAANQVPASSLNNRGAFARFMLQGTAAPGNSVTVEVGGMLFVPGLAAVSLDNAITNPPTTVKTNVTQTIRTVVTFGTATTGNTSMTQRMISAFQWN